MTPSGPPAPAGARLDGIELVQVELPLARPWRTALGTITSRRVVLARAVLGGSEGWGECVAQPEPTYTAEWEEGAWAVLEAHLVPRLLAARPTAAADVAAALAPVRGHHMARAALEAAVLDAELRAAGVALADHLQGRSRVGGARRGAVPAGIALGTGADPAALAAEVAAAAADGYARIKLKVHPGWDVEAVQAARAAAPGVPLSVDANGSYAPLGIDGAAVALGALDGADLVMVEQPLGDDDLVGHAALAGRLRTPLCLDEALPSLGAVDAALALGACRVLNIKPGRLGGLLAAVAAHDRAVAAGAAAWVGGMLETGVGRAANVALASLPGFTLPGDLPAASRWWAEDIVDRPVRLLPGGVVEVPAGAGLGVEVSVPPAAVRRRAWHPGG